MTTKVKTSVMENTTVTAGTYGSSSTISTFTVDAQGRITSASSASPTTWNQSTTGNALTATTASILNGTWNQMPAGTRMPFAQASAPTGWTQDTSDSANNRMLRVVNSAGNGIGGSASPILNNTVPSHTHTFTGNALGNHTHTDSGHTHTNGIYTNLMRPPYSGSLTGGDTTGSNSEQAVGANDSAPLSTGYAQISSTSSGTPSGTNASNVGASDWVPRYIDMIICAKN